VEICTFRATQRSGVWQVTRDNVFYGEYLTRQEAVASACSAARSYEARGGMSRVLCCPNETTIPHQTARFRH
jgi:hypothetical protein